jgi:hypothetical protein
MARRRGLVRSQASDSEGAIKRKLQRTAEATCSKHPRCAAIGETRNPRSGRRNEAYLEPARDRANLTIVGNALVDRVMFDGAIATGVRVRLPGQGWTNLSATEVVLSAGAVDSPGILIPSGLGPASVLLDLSIVPLRDMPDVGRNLLEHLIIRFTVKHFLCHIYFFLKAMMRSPHLTKSRYIAGLQCLRRLWLRVNEPPLVRCRPLQLHALAHNFGNFLRTLAVPGSTKGLVADKPEGKGNQNWPEGCQSRPICRLPDHPENLFTDILG